MALLLPCIVCTVRGKQEPEVAEHTDTVACGNGHREQWRTCPMHHIELLGDTNDGRVCCPDCHTHEGGHQCVELTVVASVDLPS